MEVVEDWLIVTQTSNNNLKTVIKSQIAMGLNFEYLWLYNYKYLLYYYANVEFAIKIFFIAVCINRITFSLQIVYLRNACLKNPF